MSHQHLIATGGGDIPIVITEAGIDDAGFHSYRHYTGGAGAGAWRECIPFWRSLGYLDGRSPEQFYGEQLAWLEAQCSIYPWLLGATVFTVGSDLATRWALYDVLDTPVFDHFLAALESYGDTTPEEPEEPEAPEEPQWPNATDCFIAAKGDRVNVRELPSISSPIIDVLEPGEARASLGFRLENGDAARPWYELVDGGHVAGWVTNHTDDRCRLIDDTPPPASGDVIGLASTLASGYIDLAEQLTDWIEGQ